MSTMAGMADSMSKAIGGAALTLAVCASVARAQPIEVKPPQQKVLQSPGGRFVFGQVSEFRRDQYMLDTQTGRLWAIVMHKPAANPDGTPYSGEGWVMLEPVMYEDSGLTPSGPLQPQK
ncbi:MAG: hypothetical protein KGL39_53620 [Patescibacteria group bacterium]|nr:hypothetical protein [Patescibacteria group bacterium]